MNPDLIPSEERLARIERALARLTPAHAARLRGPETLLALLALQRHCDSQSLLFENIVALAPLLDCDPERMLEEVQA